MKAMLLTKMKTATAVLLMLAVGGTLAGAFAYGPWGEGRSKPGEQAASVAAPTPEVRKSTPAAPKAAANTPLPVELAQEDWKRKHAQTSQRHLNRLMQELDVPREFQPIEDPRFFLDMLLNSLSEKYSDPNAKPPFYLGFVVNRKAFEEEGLRDVLETPVAEKGLPALKHYSLGRYLQRVLDRIPVPSGATYIIRDGYIEITTNAAVLNEYYPHWQKNARHLPPLVHASFDKKPLDEALRELSVLAGNYNIVVNPNLEQAQAEVTATFHNVPVDIAVEILADMAGLSVVEKGRVLYVTAKQAEAQKK